MTPVPVGLTLSLIGPIPIDVVDVPLLSIDAPGLIFVAIPLMIVPVSPVVVPLLIVLLLIVLLLAVLLTPLIVTMFLPIHIDGSK